MLIDPEICTIESKTMVGMSIVTCQLKPEETQMLWKSFMPRLKDIKDKADQNLYSIQVYPEHVTNGITPETNFQKWAAVEVKANTEVPDGFKTLQIPRGDYAIFVHHGPASSFHKTIQYIFGMWLPNSIYEYDVRPQFEIMGPDYQGHDNEDSQEQVWIPIKRKNN